MSNQLSRTLTALSFENKSILDSFLSPGATKGTPLYPLVDYLAISAIGSTEAGRLVSFTFGIGTLILVYKISKLWFDRAAGHLAMLLLSISPLFMLNSIAIKRETMLLFFSALTFFFLSKYRIEKNNWFFCLTGLALILTVLTKPVGVFIFIGVGLYLLYEERYKLFQNPAFYVSMVIPALIGLVGFVIPYLQHGGTSVPWQLIGYLDVPISLLVENIALEFAVLLPLPTLILAIMGIRRMKGLSNMGIFWLFSGILFYIVFLSGAYHHTHYASLILPPLAILGTQGVAPISQKISNHFKGEKSAFKIALPFAILIATSGVSYSYTTFMKPNEPYVEEIETVGGYVSQEIESSDTLALTQNTYAIFFHIHSENVTQNTSSIFFHIPSENANNLKLERIQYVDRITDALENMAEFPDLIVAQTKSPVYPSSYTPQGENSKWGEIPKIPEDELNEILDLDNYQILKEFDHFTVISRS